jgi:hypothetical protein
VEQKTPNETDMTTYKKLMTLMYDSFDRTTITVVFALVMLKLIPVIMAALTPSPNGTAIPSL